MNTKLDNLPIIKSWKTIPGFDGRYKASDTGEILSVYKNSVLSPHMRRKRPSLPLMQGSRTIEYYVDELIAMTFLDDWFSGCDIAHKDGNILNNCASNLLCIEAIETLEGEIWRQVPGYDGVLFVSSLGRVKTVRKEKQHLLSPFKDHDGYLTSGISLHGKSYGFRIHRLVATVFIPNPDDKPEVNHLNGLKADNRASNLEWVTKPENMQHAVRLGLCRNDSSRMKEINAKLRSTSIQCIETGQVFSSISGAADYYGVSYGTVADILFGKTKSSKQLPGKHFIILHKGDKTK